MLTRSAQHNVHMAEVLSEKQSVDTIVPVEYDRRIVRALLESSVDTRAVVAPSAKRLHRADRVPRKRGRSEGNQSKSSPSKRHPECSRQFVRVNPEVAPLHLPLFILPALQSRATPLRDARAGRAGIGRRAPSDERGSVNDAVHAQPTPGGVKPLGAAGPSGPGARRVAVMWEGVPVRRVLGPRSPPEPMKDINRRHGGGNGGP